MKRKRIVYLSLVVAMAYGAAQFGAAAEIGTDVRMFGAAGDGQTDDTEAIRRAIEHAEAGWIVFPRGDYRITETIEIHLAETGRTSLSGLSGVGRVLMDGPGPAFRFVGTHEGTANPASVDESVWQRQRMPQIDGLSIRGMHPEADGVQFVRVMQPTVRGALIREVRHGIHLTERNRNALIDSSHIYHCSGAGIYLDHVNLHQINVIGNHISYCAGGAVRVEGSEIRNLQITGNDIEYNFDAEADESVDIWIDARQGVVREGTIASNTIQASPTANGANIRLIAPERPGRDADVGMWAITGNLIGSQAITIDLNNAFGVTITGNHLYGAQEQTIRIQGCRNVIVSANTIGQTPAYRAAEQGRQGISVRNSDGIVITANVLQHAGLGSEESGGAVEVFDSRATTISGNQMLDPAYRGIYVSGSRNTLVQGNQILNGTDERAMLHAVHITGDSEATLVQGNLLGQSQRSGIRVDDATARVEGNQDSADPDS